MLHSKRLGLALDEIHQIVSAPSPAIACDCALRLVQQKMEEQEEIIREAKAAKLRLHAARTRILECSGG